ncbi:UvrD-helicase domain-containing protein [Vibrio alginolyticus]
MKLSKQQKDIVYAPLSPLSVIACAGSGKTTTAVHRLSQVRQLLNDERGYVTLLSFSNIAVDTFRREFLLHSSKLRNRHTYSDRVLIETVDSFIVGNVIRPHGSEIMGCSGIPFLVTGKENFLRNNKFNFYINKTDGSTVRIGSDKISDLTCRVVNNNVECFLQNNSLVKGLELIKSLGAVGAYTHEFGGYWGCKILKEHARLAKVLAKRYPYIIVDEAQDIGSMHAYFLTMLIKSGASVSLIGDPNQAIYEFAGADGSFLKSHNEKKKTLKYPLTVNRRSIKDIVNASSSISGIINEHIREKHKNGLGLFYCTYKKGDYKDVIDLFLHRTRELRIEQKNSAILVRSRDIKNSLRGASVSTGQGKTRLLALACIKRDLEADSLEAFKLALSCFSGMIDDSPKDFVSNVINATKSKRHYYQTKKVIWQFVRSDSDGLPSAKLHAKKEWHPKLKANVSKVLDDICKIHGFSTVEKIGNKLAATKLPDTPFETVQREVSEEEKAEIRIDTVHQSKGESLDAVMYIASNSQVRKMIEGTNTEVGRIGYVALTRARDMFVLAVPEDNKTQLSESLESLGFKFLRNQH